MGASPVPLPLPPRAPFYSRANSPLSLSLSQCKNARTAKGAASDRPTPPASQRVSGRGDAIQQMVRNRPQWVERIEGRQWRAFNPNLSPAGLHQCLAKDWTDTVPRSDSVNVQPQVPSSSARKCDSKALFA